MQTLENRYHATTCGQGVGQNVVHDQQDEADDQPYEENYVKTILLGPKRTSETKNKIS